VADDMQHMLIMHHWQQQVSLLLRSCSGAPRRSGISASFCESAAALCLFPSGAVIVVAQ
jgi:hypothetical protein